jgi:TPP-dependent pyruvate/acetoin dehydrogenase alpha subunit
MQNPELLLKAYKLMVTAKAMCETYDANRSICKYVHSSSRGHEAIQIATGLQLQKQDWVSPYYRDDSLMLSSGFTPYELMLQLLAKKMIHLVVVVLIIVILPIRTEFVHPSFIKVVQLVCRQFLQLV